VYVFCRLHFGDLILLVSRRTGSPLYDVGNLRTASALMVNLERQAVLVMVISVLLLLGKKGKLRREFVAVLLLLTTFVDLSSAHRSYHFALAPAVIEKTPRILSSAAPRLGRIFYLPQLGVLHPSTYAVPREGYVHTVGAVFSSLIPNSGVFFGFEYMQEMDALRRKPYDWWLWEGGHLAPEQLFRLLRILNVACVASPQFFSNEEIRLIESFPANSLWLYGIRNIVPRTYIAAETVMEKQPREVLERMASLNSNPTRQVILESGPALSHAQEGFQSDVSVTDYSDTQVKIRASLNDAGVLVLADSFYPGWRVYVNGQEREILKANFFFRGVDLPAGTHIVEFLYRPRSFTLGLTVSLATLGAVLLVSVAGRFKKESA